MDPSIVYGRHPGMTGVFAGNGRSLRDVPRAFLDRYPTFGSNHIDLLPYQPKYYICIDKDILTKRPESILNVASGAEIAFLSSYHLECKIPALQDLYALPNAVLVGRDTYVFAGERFMTGGTAAYVAAKTAFFMGFSTLLLVGVDHDAGWGHFTETYPTGFPTDKNRLLMQEEHMAIAVAKYARNSRRIVNLSPPSGLDKIIERGDLPDWM